ncbi:MAG: hypothetical protein AB7H97_05140, partial [Pseudobdellovibrionaceae bacterium]
QTTIKKYSDEIKQYSGFENVLQVGAVLLNSKAKMAVVDQKARVFQWSDEQWYKEKVTADSELVKRTEIFVSFFTPSKKQDDLAKKKSVWKVFLDGGGKRYEGKAVKIKSEPAELRTYYPFHNRWSSAYLITFEVATSAIETDESRLTLTGPVGSATLKFQKLEQ